ncbi:MAG: hypothetical protein PHZ11_06495 [Desulfitobacteriaceae bacterium]|nr:hypothetical protein [Desulfitobacteriaceae bacterium]MDD4346523.1 hypothetical protein [Desulfitobacteriaceae bacterium]MDD4402057.1 hypothetical protein [Desulfitobacteriaceae bacterium]
MTNPYDDIINLPHHRSTTHPHMSSHDRAAQFSPFAALTGYEDAVAETARLMDKKIELDEYSKSDLNERLNIIQGALNEQPEVSITYFLPDKNKSGGAYVTVTSGVKKIDEYEHIVVMLDATKIPIDDIAKMNGEIFCSLENPD